MSSAVPPQSSQLHEQLGTLQEKLARIAGAQQQQVRTSEAIGPTRPSEEWASLAYEDIKSFARAPWPAVRFEHSPCTRSCHTYFCTPVLCLPCVLWSCLGRVLLCPCTCGGSIGGTPMTHHSDKLVAGMCRSMDRELPPLHEMMERNGDQVPKCDAVEVAEVMAEFFVVLDKVSWKSSMLKWLGDQMRALGYTAPQEGDLADAERARSYVGRVLCSSVKVAGPGASAVC